MTDTITLPRKVVKRVMDALYYTATTKSKHPNQWKEEDAAMKELRAALEQPQGEQEPYGYVYGNSFWEAKNPRITDDVRRLGKPLYTRPHPPRQPLTDDERQDVYAKAIKAIDNDPNLSWRDAIVFETERAHGIRSQA